MPRLGDMPVDRINRADVLAVLTPIWGVRLETGRRVRQRIRCVLRWAMAHGYRNDNPAGEAIDGALPPMPRLKAHLRALPYAEVASALTVIENSGASIASKCCLRFLILTVARSGEARGAQWEEISVKASEWCIPASRMLARPHARISRRYTAHATPMRPCFRAMPKAGKSGFSQTDGGRHARTRSSAGCACTTSATPPPVRA